MRNRLRRRQRCHKKTSTRSIIRAIAPSVAGNILASVLEPDAGRPVEVEEEGVEVVEVVEDVIAGGTDDNVVAVAFSCSLSTEK